jgi:hypothetical protein
LKSLMFFAQCANQCAKKLAPLNPQPEREDTLPKPFDSHKGHNLWTFFGRPRLIRVMITFPPHWRHS